MEWPDIEVTAGLFSLLATGWASWLTYKTRKWEIMTKQAVDAAVSTKEIAKQIARQSDGMKEELVRLTALTEYQRGRRKGRTETEISTEEADALDEFTAQESLDSKQPPP